MMIELRFQDLFLKQNKYAAKKWTNLINSGLSLMTRSGGQGEDFDT